MPTAHAAKIFFGCLILIIFIMVSIVSLGPAIKNQNLVPTPTPIPAYLTNYGFQVPPSATMVWKDKQPYLVSPTGRASNGQVIDTTFVLRFTQDNGHQPDQYYCVQVPFTIWQSAQSGQSLADFTDQPTVCNPD